VFLETGLSSVQERPDRATGRRPYQDLTFHGDAGTYGRPRLRRERRLMVFGARPLPRPGTQAIATFRPKFPHKKGIVEVILLKYIGDFIFCRAICTHV